MTGNSDLGIGHLTLADIWQLTKCFFRAELVCALVFVLPYLLFVLGAKGTDTIVVDKSISKWIGYVVWVIILLWVVFNIHDMLRSLAELFAQLADWAEAMSWIKRTVFSILLVSYFLCWTGFPTIAFFISVLVMIPAGFTYDSYKKLLRNKLAN